MAAVEEDLGLPPGYKPRRFMQRFQELVGTGPVPIEPFVSTEYFEREREQIFKRCWLQVGRIEQIPEPGDYFVKDLKVCHTSIVVVRDKDGEVRAFHNVCQHRGNRLVRASKGTCRGYLSCGYHGWTYDTKGNLAAATDADNFWDLRRENHSLRAVAIDVWKGFVFINIDPNPRETLREFLGDMGRALDDYPFEDLTNCTAYNIDEKTNWKIAATSQEEGYHVPYVHDQSHGRAIPYDKKGFFRAIDLDIKDRHHRILSGPNPDFRPCAVEEITAQHMRGLVDAFAGDYQNDAVQKYTACFGYYSFFPNFHMLVLDGNYLMYSFWPLAVDRIIWEIRAYYAPAKTVGQRFAMEYGKCGIRDIVQEDVPLHEAIQENLVSGAIQHFTFHDEETTCRHTMKVVEDYVSGAYS